VGVSLAGDVKGCPEEVCSEMSFKCGKGYESQAVLSKEFPTSRLQVDIPESVMHG